MDFTAESVLYLKSLSFRFCLFKFFMVLYPHIWWSCLFVDIYILHICRLFEWLGGLSARVAPISWLHCLTSAGCLFFVFFACFLYIFACCLFVFFVCFFACCLFKWFVWQQRVPPTSWLHCLTSAKVLSPLSLIAIQHSACIFFVFAC